MNNGHIPAPAEHSPRKDMVSDSGEGKVIVWEVDKTVTGAWIKSDMDALVGVRQ